MPKILGISGSVRRGATEYAVQEALRETEGFPDVETAYWSMRGKKIGYCVHCDACIRNKTMCIIQDDLQELEKLVLEADGFIIGSPVYDMNITAQLAAVFNRLRPMYLVYPGHLQNKIGAAISTGGTRHGGQEMTNLAIINYYLMHEMLVSGGLGGSYNGGTLWTRDRKAKGAEEDEVGMDTVRRLAQGVAEAVLVTTHGRDQWLEIKKNLALSDDDRSPLRDH